jgi:hypothetical protein
MTALLFILKWAALLQSLEATQLDYNMDIINLNQRRRKLINIRLRETQSLREEHNHSISKIAR